MRLVALLVGCALVASSDSGAKLPRIIRNLLGKADYSLTPAQREAEISRLEAASQEKLAEAKTLTPELIAMAQGVVDGFPSERAEREWPEGKWPEIDEAMEAWVSNNDARRESKEFQAYRIWLKIRRESEALHVKALRLKLGAKPVDPKTATASDLNMLIIAWVKISVSDQHVYDRATEKLWEVALGRVKDLPPDMHNGPALQRPIEAYLAGNQGWRGKFDREMRKLYNEWMAAAEKWIESEEKLDKVTRAYHGRTAAAREDRGQEE